MKVYRFAALRQKDSWLFSAFVSINERGEITSIENTPPEGQHYEEIEGYALPSFPNSHSHAFQYAMAGLAEVHPKIEQASDFWSWRSKMYEIALTVDPDDVQDIATMLYSEMVRHGYSHVAEFHYLHHGKDGKPYSNIAEMGERLVAAALSAGINITIIPMLYQQGGFNKSPEENQRRFISTNDEYFKIIEILSKTCNKYAHATLGYGVHSLRAARKENILAILRQLGNSLPFHTHIAEQLKEVEEAQRYLGLRPVQWLLENFEVNKNFNLVHATHLSDHEIRGIAASKANIVLCPSTEGNLGDGIFRLNEFHNVNGRWCIGTDSHIGLNPLEELRILDYGQRLTTHRRNTFVPQGGDSAQYALHQSICNGKSACGVKEAKDYFEIGQPLDAVILDGHHPLLSGGPDYWLSTILYHFDASNIRGTLINGRMIVKQGIHRDQNTIFNRFSKTLHKLKIRM